MNIRTPIIITLFVTVIAIIGINGLNNYKLKTLNIAYENNVAKTAGCNNCNGCSMDRLFSFSVVLR
jgi:hypothetical protein